MEDYSEAALDVKSKISFIFKRLIDKHLSKHLKVMTKLARIGGDVKNYAITSKSFQNVNIYSYFKV